jgi:hypothetical protein
MHELLKETGNESGIKAYLPAATSRSQTNVRADVCSGGTTPPPAHVPEPSGEALHSVGHLPSSRTATLPPLPFLLAIFLHQNMDLFLLPILWRLDTPDLLRQYHFTPVSGPVTHVRCTLFFTIV